MHYLGSIAAVNPGLPVVLVYTFESSIESFWLPFTAIPYFYLHARDLRYNGYSLGDLVRAYALNLLLIPINLSGVAKSIQQGVTGQRIPLGRTSARALYVLAEYGLAVWWLAGFGIDIVHEGCTRSVFVFLNAALLSYAIVRVIGLRESWEDICLAVPGLQLKRGKFKAAYVWNFQGKQQTVLFPAPRKESRTIESIQGKDVLAEGAPHAVRHIL